MDVDIDFPSDFDPLDYFKQAVRASMIKNGKLIKHPAGAYLQRIPTDKITGFAAIPYKEAEDVGYFKVDFLHLSLLDNFESKEQIKKLSKIPPDWCLLEDEEVVKKLFQLHSHYKLVSKVKPHSVIELADCTALIRPGKRFLVDTYLKDRDVVRQELYRKSDDGKYYFKKSHAVAYALTIVIQLHLIKGGIL